ncbi:retrovirus-related pol polyprotein from transposon TNT 1-94 [Tanacetum coccineum]
MRLSLAENVIVAGADNRPPMLNKTNYSSWASRMMLYIKGKEHGKLLVDSVLNGPFQYETMIWDRVKLLIQGSELSLQERESKLYDDFDTCTSMPGETIHSYYMQFAQLINDMHMIGMTMKPLQVNTKFVNHLQPEWSKFVTDVKLAKDMHTTNFDHLYAHLRKHEAHANEVRLSRQMYPDQITLVANSLTCLNPTQYYPQLSSATKKYYSPPAPQRSYDAPIVQLSHYQPQFVTNSQVVHQQPYQAHALQQSYQTPAIQQPSFTELDSGFVVSYFNPSDDPIANLNKLMVFVSTTFGPRFPQTNNQLRTSSNPRNQATIQDGRVTVHTVQGRQTPGYVNTRARNNATNQGGNRNGAVAQPRAVKCYNCQEEGHFARQCTKPKRPKNSVWFKEKMLLTEALESGAYLDPEQLAFLADNEDAVIPAQASQEIPTPAAFHADNLDAFDSDCDDVPLAKAVLMANLSSYDSDVLSKTQCSEQPIVDNDTEIDITSDSNIISYEQYLQEIENSVVQNTSFFAQQDELLTAVIEEMSSQVAKCNKVQHENLIVHETLTAELERHKEQVKLFEQRLKFELNDREKYIDGQLRQVIVDRNAKVADFEKQIHSLKLQLNATVESHKTFSTTVECLKKESKQKEDKYLDEVINLQNKNKALDNVVYKIG